MGSPELPLEPKELNEANMEEIYEEIKSKLSTYTQDDLKTLQTQSKEKGNEAFKNGEQLRAVFYYSASLLYTNAISDIDPSEHKRIRAILYSNRSASRLLLEQPGYALEDAEKAVESDNTYFKSYYRLGGACSALSKLGEALDGYRNASRLQQNNKALKARLEAARKLFIESQFALAIATDTASETIDIESLPLNPSYDGPILDLSKKANEGRYTVNFINDLTAWFRADHQNAKKFPIRYISAILVDIIGLLKTLPSLVDVSVPKGSKITVCGDTHGQFYDVFTIFKKNGEPSETNPYLFNGDFVDRGSFSYELIITFFLYKLVYPNHFHLNRGNHESVSMNMMYGFKGEVIHKANEQVFELFTEAFNWLPIAYCLDHKVLVLHGGLFEKDGVTLDHIRSIDRFKQPPEKGIMCDALWSDPSVKLGLNPPHRGCGTLFGPDVTKQFCEANNLKYLVRSHEMKPKGYSVDHDGKCITVFSAPNYCDSMGNAGAYLVFDDTLEYKVEQFYHVPHPDVPVMKYGSPLLQG